MALGEQHDAAEEDQGMMPGMSPQDPTTYDPSQGAGTPAWQATKAAQAQLNERLGLNAHFRRN